MSFNLKCSQTRMVVLPRPPTWPGLDLAERLVQISAFRTCSQTSGWRSDLSWKRSNTAQVRIHKTSLFRISVNWKNASTNVNCRSCERWPETLELATGSNYWCSAHAWLSGCSSLGSSPKERCMRPLISCKIQACQLRWRTGSESDKEIR